MSRGLRMDPQAVARHNARVKSYGGPSTSGDADPVAQTAAKKSKYGNEKTIIDGIVFHSKREADRYLVLKAMRDAGEIIGLRLQPHLPCDVNGTHVCTYVADFAYTRPGIPRETFEDVKGHRTALYILKKKLVRACHGIDIEEV